MNTINRPGITAKYLEDNGVAHVSAEEARGLCGCPASGLIIPYRDAERQPIYDPGEKPFHRLRKDVAGAGYKYHQQAGTGIHVYLPSNSQADTQSDDLAIIEGEFKSMALTDPHQGFAFPAMGISGFYGFHLGRKEPGEDLKPAPELATALDVVMPQRISFIGDSDTSLNHDFAIAAVRLKAMFPGYTVVLPRINLDEPKGMDDCRRQMKDKFELWFQNKLDRAIEVLADTTPDLLAFTLLKSQVEFIAAMSPENKMAVSQRIITLLAHTDEFARQQMFELLKKPLGIGKTELTRMVNNKLHELATERLEEAADKIREQVKDQFFFDGKGYYRRNTDDTYFPLAGRENVFLHLQENQKLIGPAADRALYLIQAEQQVAFAGNVAGRQAGLYQAGGAKVLVMASPQPTQAKEGDCEALLQFLAELFGKGVDPLWQIQLDTFLGYLHFARLGLKNPDTALQGQVLALLGSQGVGKTLVQEKIITPLIGGRQADPSDVFVGKTVFNEDLIGAEHLCLSDGAIDTDPKIRQQFRGQLKRQVANPTKAWTKKYIGRTHVQPVQRMTMSANLDASGISIIPELDSSIRDKITLLKCYPPTRLPTSEAAARVAFINMIHGSLPALAFKIDSFIVPETLEDDRFGIAAFHHPDILQLTGQKDALLPLRTLLDSFLLENPGFAGGTAECWWNRLKDMFGDPFLAIAGNHKALGRLFGELKTVPAWADRIDNSKREQYGTQRNYVATWIIRSHTEAAIDQQPCGITEQTL